MPSRMAVALLENSEQARLSAPYEHHVSSAAHCTGRRPVVTKRDFTALPILLIGYLYGITSCQLSNASLSLGCRLVRS
jgi:hypothetical protein